MMKVLVVEDDAETAEEIVDEFSAAGFDVVRAATGPDGLAKAQTQVFDVITLDRLLPGLDGLSLLEILRGGGVDTPVLVLSALSSVDERIRGLRAGGDDYLVKPFSPAELRTRVEVLARRSPDPRLTILRLHDLELDLLTRTVRRGSREVDLVPREIKLLEYMLRHANQVVTRAMLFEQVWHYRFDPGTNLVDVHLGRLRRKIDQPGEVPLIHTVRGRGFVLRAQN
ncbi:DNA-binding response regulator [Mesorhizobium sp. SARCC-RB16n]|uniref:response regulator transcription factor n=1 Tax=Mesorhizobium sp. SARCC-RB16n TaxID=2116687 RepID=UPI00122FACD3|nr:response regulator transcription factor [Mesorhizobium sp. SARCC-RB16n]KAA3451672.1 DNA-binding response regulator [Mesorhizobium sp. SARCC-RB16n]